MPSRFENCLNTLQKQGRIDDAQKQEVLEAFRSWKAKGADDAQAGMEASAVMLWKKQQSRAQAAEQILKAREIVDKAAQHPRGFGVGAHSYIIADKWGEAGHVALADVIGAYRGALHAKFVTGLDAYRSKVGGLKRDVPGLVSMIREHYGEATGDTTAAASARAFREMNDFAADEFIAAGGAMAKRDNYFPNPRIRPERIQAEGKEAFSAYLHEGYDSGRLQLIDFATQEPASPMMAKQIIAAVVDTLESGGLNKLTPGQFGGRKTGNRRIDPRILHWTTADAWIDANRRWGAGDAGIWEMLNHHIGSMAHDIGMMKVLGPNPQGMVRVLADEAKKRLGIEDGKAWAQSINNAFDTVSGKLSTPVHEVIGILGGRVNVPGPAAWNRQLGALHTGSKLLSSPISAIGDIITLAGASAWNGLPVTKIMGSYLKAFGPGGHLTRKDAIASGLEADFWIGRAHAAAREMEGFGGSTFLERAADFLLRASGANVQANSARAVFQLGWLRELADMSGRDLTDLRGRTQRAFQRAGIDGDDWKRIRQATHTFEGGDTRIYPELLMQGERQDIDAGIKLLSLIHREQDFAQVMADARADFARVWGTQAGTFGGFFAREAMRFKSYSVSIITTHVNRMIYEASGQGRMAYVAAFVTGMTVMGALSMQLRQIRDGKDPRDMADAKFWGGALLQGGGLGLFGDFLNAGVNRSGNQFFEASFGPTVAMIADATEILLGNVRQAAEGKNTNWGREAVRFLRNHTPGSNMWYGRKAMEEYFWQFLQKQVDPQYDQALRRVEQRARKEYNQDFWWPMGETRPVRGPDLGAIVGGSR